MSDIAKLLQPLQSRYCEKLDAATESYETVASVERLLHDTKKLVSETETAKNQAESQLVTTITSHLLGYAKGVDKINKVWDAHKNANPELYDEQIVKDDQRIIKVYNENDRFSRIKESLQEAYDSAATREAEREEYSQYFDNSNEALIVTRTNQTGTLELYVSVPFSKRNKDLHGKLGEVVTAIIPQGYELSDAQDANGIVRYDVANGDNQLVKSLGVAKPHQLKHAGVEYNVVSVDELVSGEIQHSQGEAITVDEKVNDPPIVPAKKARSKKKPESDVKEPVVNEEQDLPSLEKGQYLRDISDTVKTQDYKTARLGYKKGSKKDIKWVEPLDIGLEGRYIAVRDIQIIEHLDPSQTYKKFIDMSEDASGKLPVKTVRPGKSRLATLESFLETFGETVVFNLDETSEILIEKWKQVKEMEITPKQARKKIGDQKFIGKLAMIIGHGPERYVSQPEMERWIKAFVK